MASIPEQETIFMFLFKKIFKLLEFKFLILDFKLCVTFDKYP